MVQVRIATGVTRVVWTAVVLRCGKQMEKLPHYHFSWIVSLDLSFKNLGPCQGSGSHFPTSNHFFAEYLGVSLSVSFDQYSFFMVRASDYWSGGPGFDSRLYHGNFPCRRRIPVVTMVWVVSRFRHKAPPGTSSPYITPLTPSGQRNCASWASLPQKSVTLPPQPGGVDHESSYEHVVALGEIFLFHISFFYRRPST